MTAWVVLICIGLPALLLCLFYFPQRRFVFSPTYYPNRSWFMEHADCYHLHRLKVAPGIEIEGITYEPDHSILTVLYFGGKEQDSFCIYDWTFRRYAKQKSRNSSPRGLRHETFHFFGKLRP